MEHAYGKKLATIVIGVGALAVAGCYEGTPLDALCDGGPPRTCTCHTGGTGTQSCGDDGRWGFCHCDPPPDAGAPRFDSGSSYWTDGGGDGGDPAADSGTGPTGAECFRPYPSGSVPPGVTELVTADFDGDGSTDVLVGGRGSAILHVLYGDGTGGIHSDEDLAIGGGLDYSVWNIHAADVTGDDRPDVVGSAMRSTSSDTDQQAVFVVPQAEALGFEAPVWTLLQEGTFSGPASTVLSLDSDPIADVVVALERPDGSHDIALLVSDGTGGFGTPSEVPLDGTLVHDLVSADLTGDGAPEIVAADRSHDALSVLVNDGSGGFAPPVRHVVGQVVALEATDVDGDGHTDVVTGLQSGSLGVSRGVGDGTLHAIEVVPVPFEPLDVVIGSFDGDPDVDAAVLGRSDVLLILGGLTGGGTRRERIFRAPCLEGIGAGDLDSDGRLDLLVASCAGELEVLFAMDCRR